MAFGGRSTEIRAGSIGYFARMNSAQFGGGAAISAAAAAGGTKPVAAPMMPDVLFDRSHTLDVGGTQDVPIQQIVGRLGLAVGF